jgi:hypothetical protein
LRSAIRISFFAVGLIIALIVVAIPSATSAHDVHSLFKTMPMVASRDGRLDVDLVAARLRI